MLGRMGWFSRKQPDFETPEQTLAQFHAEQASRVTAGQPGQMTVEDVFQITGRGLVATGRISSGVARVDTPVRIERADGSSEDSQIAAIEAFRKVLREAPAGENVGILFGTSVSVARGDILHF